MSTQPTFGTAEDADIETMWADALQEILSIDAATENWKNQSLPLARIKKVMKSEELILQELERDRHKQAADEEGLQAAVERASNTKFMISGEAPVLMGKACELMIKELTIRAWRHTERNKRKTLQRQDLHAAVGESETYDFLIDFIPRLPSSPGITQMLTNPATAIAGLPQGMIPGAYFAQPGLPQALPLQVPPAGFNFAEGLTAGEAAQFVQQPQDQAALAYQQQQMQQQQQQLQQMQQQQQLQQQMQQQQQQQQQHLQQQEQQHLQQQQPELHEQDLGQDTDTTALASGDTQAAPPEHANDPLWVFESSDGHFNDPSSGV